VGSASEDGGGLWGSKFAVGWRAGAAETFSPDMYPAVYQFLSTASLVFVLVIACANGLFEWIGQVLELGKLACVNVPTQRSAARGGVEEEWLGA